MIDLTPIVQAVITLAAALITVYLIPWLKSRTTVEQQTYVRMAVQVAVYAAEKAYGAGHGEEKLAYAEQVLARHNVKLETEKLKALIDAEIKNMELFAPEEQITVGPAADDEESAEDDAEVS